MEHKSQILLKNQREMPRYEKCILNLGPYQEGNIESEEFEMDVSFPMDDISLSLQVRDGSGKLLVEKSSTEGTIVISGQNFGFQFLPKDFKRKSGKYQYEIDFINSDGQPFVTIGGLLQVNHEINTR